jgi:GNAT superfamily N-acetyltransferase
MTEGDLDAVAAIALTSFPNHFEGRPCFANRLALHPQGCFVLARDGEPARGYLIAYPWSAESAPPLNTSIESLPADAAVMYLHDLALHPQARGTGQAAAMVEQLAADARAAGWPALALVAVNAAESFWLRHGFQIHETPALRQKLATYGSNAHYMLRPL